MEYRKTQKRKKRNSIQVMLEWSVGLLVALVVVFLITQFVIINAQVPSESMENTIVVGDRIIGFRLAYLGGAPRRGDIIIFRLPDDETQIYVKRVIGLPGEEVRIENGLIYINGSETPLEDPYPPEKPMGSFGPYIVPEGRYFVMGDNRNYSWDSRYWVSTYVPEGNIIGKAVFRLYPNTGMLE